jgi:hypothetical protein
MSSMDDELSHLLDDAPITADEAIARTIAQASSGEGGTIGTLSQPEALRFAETIFGEDMPDDIRSFFTSGKG